MKYELTAKRLQAALTNTHMKPQELANRSGVSKSSISQYVNGVHVPSVTEAKRLEGSQDQPQPSCSSKIPA